MYAHDDRELMRVDADTSFTYDARGRMVLTNEPCAAARRPAPWLFLGRTRSGRVARFNTALPDPLVEQLEALLSPWPPTDDLQRPLAEGDVIHQALSAHVRVEAAYRGPAYRFPETLVAPVDVTPVAPANRELARDTYPWLYEEVRDWQPCFAVVRDGAAVSICFSSRWGVTAAAAGVETLPDFRGRGYASAVTAAWATAVRDSGRIPLYSTDWPNLASQGVARRLGLITFGEHLSWR